MRYHTAVAVVLVLFISTSFAADEKTPAEKQFERLKIAIPKIIKECDLPPVLPTAPDKGGPTTWIEIRVARMTSPDTAKVTLLARESGVFIGDPVAITRGTLQLHLRWYRGAWTITQQDKDGLFATQPGNVLVAGYLDLIPAIDAFGEPKPVPKK